MSLVENSVTLKESKVLEVRELTSSTYVLRIEKNNLSFKAGQYITLGHPEDFETREYSIYSGENDPYLEVLIREIDSGIVSRQLKDLKPGEKVKIDGPFGFFNLDDSIRQHKKVVLIASGTGISPFRSYVRSYQDLDYTLLHGIRYAEEQYEKSNYNPSCYVACVSGEKGGNYHGRVTNYLKENPVDLDAHIYLCGNCNMIYDAYDILNQQGFPTAQIHTEVYF